jgi:hypothetical protein
VIEGSRPGFQYGINRKSRNFRKRRVHSKEKVTHSRDILWPHTTLSISEKNSPFFTVLTVLLTQFSLIDKMVFGHEIPPLSLYRYWF